MSYQVLARKWRPASFEQVVGQSHVLHALTNALSQQRLHHAYLFTGTRGVGKTSLARLFAKGLNCEQGITATPCGKCSACQEIAQGRFVDLIEVDAASRTKVDDTRELLDNVQYRPSRGRFKVYLIDEVHMLSRSSFNALLKTLEEPPEHVKFLLATTDPQKLPVTVLSRCLQFNLKSLTQDEIARQLQHIVSAEALPFEPQALALLAKAANGSMRDALSLTDQAIAFGAGQIKLQQVQTMLGAIDERQVITLLQALVQADVAPLMQEAERILAFGADANEVLRSLLELLHQITLTQFAPAAAQLSLYADQIQEFAEQLSAEQVQLYYQLLLQGRKDLPFAPDPKSGLEMALLRAVAFVPETPPQRWQSTATHGDKPVFTAMSGIAPTTDKSVPVSTANPYVSTAATPTPSDATTAPTSADIEDDEIDEDDAAFIAEQTLILSQAESMGHQYQQDEPINSGEDASAELPFRDELTSDMFAAELPKNELQAALVEEPQATPSTTSLFGDELLDQVLATREQLLQDIDALATDETPAKIPEHQHDSSSKKNTEIPLKGSAIAVASAANTGAPKPAESDADGMADEPFSDNSAEVYGEWAAQHVDEPSLPDSDDTTFAPSDNAVPATVAVADTQTVAASPAPASSTSVTAAVDGANVVPKVAASAIEAPAGNPADLGWYKLVSSLPIRGRVRQLAANSVCLSLSEKCLLLLKPDQKHLAAAAAINQLQQTLLDALQRPLTVELTVGNEPGRETPQEIRQRFKKELLAHAGEKLLADDKVRWLVQHMGATLEADSLSYNPEQLVQKTALIPDGQLPQ